ncbi:MAG: radical SAM family heme chaperone HemW [Desulfovibrio sp.]
MAIYGNVPVTPAFPFATAKPDKSAKATEPKGILLYIHVPFCRAKCHYCAFHSEPFTSSKFDWYYSTLLQEIELWGKRLNRPKVQTVFFGGGTPSLAPLHRMDGIFKQLHQWFDIHPEAEISMEANPESSQDESWFRGLLSIGFNRLSLGVQSLSDDVLLRLGRPHSAAQAVTAFATARQAGFNNISMDLIWGLPEQTFPDWAKQLKSVVQMKPDHISCYGLSLDEGSHFSKLEEDGVDLQLPDEQQGGRMYLYGAEFLEAHGLIQYEVSNFAKIGYTCRHNIGYWQGVDYLGLGPAATSTIGTRRFTNPKDLMEYEDTVTQGRSGADFEHLDKETQTQEWVMLSLRTTMGLDLKEYKERTGKDLNKVQKPLIEALYRNNLIRINKGMLRLTREGMLVSNTIVERLAF